ncbi:hypothetical protein [Spirosoma endophyticum]|uniref:Carboxypeptidase regulatory-like domain-containing protein n=1 Tax=Spirosoma endophyticum TaxID=662367 RepID=A0A1I2GSS2_9BACT|nr:hypothetical protein [Spirosoma endophyticum]SFF20994.1 hypothetical protein SAMN05216167_13532 [Spirosoma endophyticum]
MKTIKAVRYSLLVALLTGCLSCGFTAVDKETSVTGTVLLNTGEPVQDYPLTIVAKKGTGFGVSNQVSRQDIYTDQNGAFSYQGLFKSGGLGGLGYELQWAFSYKIQGQYYSVDTVQAAIPEAMINFPPGYHYDGHLFPGKQHTIKIIVKKN